MKSPAAGTRAPANAPLRARDLGADATFADLVRAARLAIQAGDADSAAGCLLTRREREYELSADLMPALDALPDPPVELDARLRRQTAAARILSAWGQVGSLAPGVVLAAFTSFGPENLQALGLVLLLTDEGVYLRYTDAAAGAQDGPLPVETAIARLLAAPHNAHAALYVTAEAAVPIAQLAELLRSLPQDRSVALVLALPPDTRVPIPIVEARGPQTCPAGLPEPAEASVEGELASQAILPALEPLRKQAQACLEQARGAARAGGRFVLALRIAQEGRVQDSCVQEDATEDALLELCILASARALRFPRPDPAGFVDLRLPLSLAPASAPAQRPLCE